MLIADTWRRRILEAIAQHQGMTADEVAVLLEGTHNTISSRVTELANQGLIKETGKYRRTRKGRPAIVWESSGGA